jgi:hypothetical protein
LITAYQAITSRATSRDPIYYRRRYNPKVIELCVRWYLTYRLSYRDLPAMMAERDISVSHTTMLRWVQHYVPEFERRWARFAQDPRETLIALGLYPEVPIESARARHHAVRQLPAPGVNPADRRKAVRRISAVRV